MMSAQLWSSPVKREKKGTHCAAMGEMRGRKHARIRIDELLIPVRNALAHIPSPPPSLGDGSPSSPAGGRGHKDSHP